MRASALPHPSRACDHLMPPSSAAVELRLVGAPASGPGVRALHAAIQLRVVCSQAFASASAFNANIGAWNTARLTNLFSVCAASGRLRMRRFRPSAHRGGRARSVFDACAAVVRGGATLLRL
jgi:hypothetical protein